MDSSALSAGIVPSPANEGAIGTQQAAVHTPGASAPLLAAIARASQFVCQAQDLCDRAETHVFEGGESGGLESVISALNLQIGVIGHLLDCAMRAAGEVPVRSSLAEWLAIGDIEAALSNLAVGVTQ